MDVLSLIKPQELAEFTESYSYDRNFMGQKLFTPVKTENPKIAYEQLVEGGELPVMAQVHALDTEARIGERPNYKKVELEKLLIKEKLPVSERVAYFLRNGGNQDGIVRYIFNDAANLISRVITRTEVANMELLSTGKITIEENNAKYSVDYGFSADNKLSFSGWEKPAHGILSEQSPLLLLSAICLLTQKSSRSGKTNLHRSRKVLCSRGLTTTTALSSL